MCYCIQDPVFIIKLKMTGETPEVRSDKRKQREKEEKERNRERKERENKRKREK